MEALKDCFLLVVEFIEVLHVSKDDVLLVDDSWRNLLHPAGHLPQVGLHKYRTKKSSISLKDFQILCKKLQHGCGMEQVNSGGLESWTYIHALPQVSHVGFFCLNQLCHDEPRLTQRCTEAHTQAVN